MQLKKFHQNEMEVDSLSNGNLGGIQPALRHLIDFITVQHQVGCESVMLIKKDVLIRNIKQYLLATLYNAPVTVDSYYSAQVRHEFGWGSRVDKN